MKQPNTSVPEMKIIRLLRWHSTLATRRGRFWSCAEASSSSASLSSAYRHRCCYSAHLERTRITATAVPNNWREFSLFYWPTYSAYSKKCYSKKEISVLFSITPQDTLASYRQSIALTVGFSGWKKSEISHKMAHKKWSISHAFFMPRLRNEWLHE